MVDKVVTSSTLIDICGHFKLTAGPGAGKTYWLVNNIKHLLNGENKLGKSGKIACVTYTNVGVDTIASRLGSTNDRVEVITIHSFLFKHIVKPYLYLVADEEGFEIKLFKGLDSRFCFDYTTLSSLKSVISQEYADDECIKSAIKLALWKIENNCIICRPKDIKYCDNNKQYKLNTGIYLLYKQKAWAKGIMHYDDVHFFAYKILKKYPFLFNVLACQFPYVFVDEFQDSTPIQMNIIRNIGKTGSTIGVIGDPAQSIFNFTGATVDGFLNFELDNITSYKILENRRSTKTIISLLNGIREDFKQLAISCSEEGEKPIVIVGSLLNCHEKALGIANGGITALAYSNVEANSLKKLSIDLPSDPKLLENFKDSNERRKEMVSCYIKSLEHAKFGNFKSAIQILSKNGICKGKAVNDLRQMLIDYEQINEMSLYDFYRYLVDKIKIDITKMKPNTDIYEFYSSHCYRELSFCVNHEDDDSTKRTIHKSKGDEFENVMLWISDENKISFFDCPDLYNQKNEWQRVYYVAMSRARKKLFIAIPSLNDKEEILRARGFEIVKL